MRKLLFLLVCLSLGASAQTAQASPLKLEGEITQGSMIIGHAPKGAEVFLDDKPIKVAPDGRFVFGFGRNAELEHQLSYSYRGKTHKQQITLSQRQYKVDRIEGVESKYVTPPKERLARIRADGVAVRQARATDSNSLHFLDAFMMPAKGRISGVYGSQRIFNGKPKNPHYGLDVAGPVGTQVVAPIDGVVTLAKDLYYSGNTLVIDHGYGVSTSYLHLSKMSVKPGDKVKKGQKIGEIGATGRVTGPHLDWRLNWYQVRLDPQLLFRD